MDENVQSSVFKFDPGILTVEFCIYDLKVGKASEKKCIFDFGKYHPEIVEETSYGPHVAVFEKSIFLDLYCYFDLKFMNIGISVEEHCEKFPLFPIASSYFQYDPILSIIFSLLSFRDLLGQVSLVNTHFRSVIRKMIFTDLTFSEKTFLPVQLRNLKNVRLSLFRLKEFFVKIISTEMKTKSLTLVNEDNVVTTFNGKLLYYSNIFQDYRFSNLPIIKTEFEDFLSGKIDSITPSLEEEVSFSELPLLRDLDLSPFKFLFRHLVNLTLDHTHREDLVSLINHIRTLEHIDILDLHFRNDRKSYSILQVNENLKVLQCGFVNTEDYTILFFENIGKEIENFGIDVLKKCKRLTILQLPILGRDMFHQAVFYDEEEEEEEKQKKESEEEEESEEIEGEQRYNLQKTIKKKEKKPLSELKKYLRRRFLDEKGNYIQTHKKHKFKKCIPLHFNKFECSQLSGSTGTKKSDLFYTIRRRVHLIVEGIPIQLYLQYSNSGLSLLTNNPYVKFICRLPNTNRPSVTFNDGYSNRCSYYEGNQENDFMLGKDLELGIKKDNDDVPIETRWGKIIPIKIHVDSLFKKDDIFIINLKRSEKERKERYKKDDEMEMINKKKEILVRDILLKQQKLSNKSDSIDIEVEIRDIDVICTSLEHYFSLFDDDLMDWKMEYCLYTDSPRRNLFFFRKFPGEDLVISGRFKVEIILCYDDEGDNEERNYDCLERKFEMTSSSCFYNKFGFWSFLFCIPDDENRMEKSLRVKVTFLLTNEVLEMKNVLERHLRFFQENKIISGPFENTGFIRTETKEFELIVDRNDIEQQSRPRISEDVLFGDNIMISLCGIDFTVQFTPFELKRSKGRCSMTFRRLFLFLYRKLRIFGKFSVEVLDNSNERITISQSGREGEVFKTTRVYDLCPVDLTRNLWRFRVTLDLFDLKWVDEEN